MSDTVFAERVNAVSNIISNMTGDTAQRFGLAMAVAEIFRHELTKNLVMVTPNTGGQNAAANTNSNAPAGGNT